MTYHGQDNQALAAAELIAERGLEGLGEEPIFAILAAIPTMLSTNPLESASIR